MGEFRLPRMGVGLWGGALPSLEPRTQELGSVRGFVMVYGLIVAGVLDAVLLWRRTKAKIIAKFGEAPPRGSAMYAVIRAFQMRRSRLPRPQVARGDKPA